MKMMKNLKLLALPLFITFILSCDSDDEGTTPSDNIIENPEQEAAFTIIPDEAFENYLVDSNIDDIIDGKVLTSKLATVEQIVVDNLGIADLTGIEDCPNLFNLWAQNNNLTTLNVSQNPALQFIYADGNNLSSIDISNQEVLEKLSFRNNQLTAIDISGQVELELLEINGNELTELDVSNNPALFRLDIRDNPLECITASQEQIDNPNLMWMQDEDDTYSLDCN